MGGHQHQRPYSQARRDLHVFEASGDKVVNASLVRKIEVNSPSCVAGGSNPFCDCGGSSVIDVTNNDSRIFLAFKKFRCRCSYDRGTASNNNSKREIAHDVELILGISGQALGSDGNGVDTPALLPDPVERESEPESLEAVMATDLNFARSWAATFGSAALTDWLSSEQGNAPSGWLV